jgi:hypothetical protein
MQVQVEVTQDDICNGFRGDCTECPIALALERALPGHHIEVGNDSVWSSEEHLADLPADAVAFIVRFDLWGRSEAEPFRFTLTIPD